MGNALLIALTMENYKKMLVIKQIVHKDVEIPLLKKHERILFKRNTKNLTR